MRQDNVYKTKDIFESAWIYSKNIKLLGLIPNGKYSDFIFEDKSKCEILSGEYWSQAAVGNIKQFVNSLKTLKDFIFSKQQVI